MSLLLHRPDSLPGSLKVLLIFRGRTLRQNCECSSFNVNTVFFGCRSIVILSLISLVCDYHIKSTFPSSLIFSMYTSSQPVPNESDLPAMTYLPSVVHSIEFSFAPIISTIRLSPSQFTICIELYNVHICQALFVRIRPTNSNVSTILGLLDTLCTIKTCSTVRLLPSFWFNGTRCWYATH